MKLPSILKHLVIIVVGVLILGVIYKYQIADKPTENVQQTTQANPPPPPVLEVEVDYNSIMDADVRVLFLELGKEYKTSNLYSSHVLTVFNGNNKTEYVEYTVEYRNPQVPWSSTQKMTREEHDVYVSAVQDFFRIQGYAVAREDARETSDYISTRINLTKNQIACVTDVSNFYAGSVLLCQRQVPNYGNLVNPITDSIQESNNLITSVAVRYISGNYARGTMSMIDRPEVWDWLAVKSNGKWTKVAEVVWTCDLVMKNNIPVEIYKDCIKSSQP
jgi:hypothetical protein